MRIAHVSATFPPYYGGTGNVCFHNARILVERGHEVHVVTATWPGERIDPKGVTVHRVRPLVRAGNAPLLPRLAHLKGFDIIHVHCPFISGAELVALGSVARRTPLVLTYHNDLVAPGVRGRIFSLYERSMTRFVLKAASRICVVSTGHARGSRGLREVLLHRPEIVTEVPNGVDPLAFAELGSDPELRSRIGIPVDATIVAFVAVLDVAHQFKRLDLLLRAVAALDDRSVHVLIVGDGGLRPSYVRLAESLGIRSRTHWVGAVPHQDLPPLLAESDLLVLPSDSVESFGLVLIEAMASAKPVIATGLPGVREIVTDGVDGLLAAPGDLADLSAKLASLVGDSGRRRQMGRLGREKVLRLYSWNTIGERLERVYEDVLSGTTVGAPVQFGQVSR